jgi:hypothetical protein
VNDEATAGRPNPAATDLFNKTGWKRRALWATAAAETAVTRIISMTLWTKREREDREPMSLLPTNRQQMVQRLEMRIDVIPAGEKDPAVKSSEVYKFSHLYPGTLSR